MIATAYFDLSFYQKRILSELKKKITLIIKFHYIQFYPDIVKNLYAYYFFYGIWIFLFCHKLIIKVDFNINFLRIPGINLDSRNGK